MRDRFAVKRLSVCLMLLLPHAAIARDVRDPATSMPAAAGLPTPRPALKPAPRGEFPFRGWSYAKAYTFNFFAEGPVPLRVVSDAGQWSPHIRSEQLITDDHARQAAKLVAATRGSIELTKCTFPRHAVVYFDADDRPVASTDVCFSCEAVLVWPDYEHPDGYDYEKAAATLEKTLPLWRELFERELKLPIDYKGAAAVP